MKIFILKAGFNWRTGNLTSLSHLCKKYVCEYHGSFEQNNELLEIFYIILKAGFKFYFKEAANIYDHPFLRKKTKHDI